MKVRTVIDPECEEEIVIYSRRKTELSEKIEALIRSEEDCLIVYRGEEIIQLSIEDIDAFAIEGGEAIAAVGNDRFRMKQRLYELERKFSHSFVKINQSCLMNVSRIARCRAGFGGSLMIISRGGFSDYVSRRQMKAFKERMGL